MRKKIIKFYFFKSFCKNPSVNYMFAFSKRALKQSRKLFKLKKRLRNIKSIKRKNEVIKYISMYKNLIQNRIFLNQWLLSTTKLKYLFNRSFFYKLFSTMLQNRSRLKKIKIWKFWFTFKNQFYKFIRRFIKSYLRLGFLSSHYVHIFSKKNLTYQARSKFRAQVTNFNVLNQYSFSTIKHLLIYRKYLYKLLYFLTLNHTKRNYWLDSDFTRNVSKWNFSNIKYTVNMFETSFYCQTTIHPDVFNIDVFTRLNNQRDLILAYFYTPDKQQQDDLRVKLMEIFEEPIFDYIYSIKFQNKETSDVYLPGYTMYKHIYLYNRLYNVT